MAVRNPPGWMQLRDDHTAENDRLYRNGMLQGPADGGLSLSGGGVKWSDGTSFQVQPTSPASMTVHISAGIAWVKGTQGGSQGLYAVVNDAVVSQAINAADATNPRTDIIYVQIQDGNYSGTNNQCLIGYTAGTPGAGAPAPAAPSNSLVLAQISVPAGASSITSARVIDMRSAVVPMGGVLPIKPSTTNRPYPGAFTGRVVYNEDNDRLMYYTANGSGWQSADPTVWGSTGSPNISLNPGDDHDSTFNITIPRPGRLKLDCRVHVRLTQDSLGTLAHTEMFYAGISVDAQDLQLAQINAAGTDHRCSFLTGIRDVNNPGTVAIIVRVNNTGTASQGAVLFADYSFTATLGVAGS